MSNCEDPANGVANESASDNDVDSVVSYDDVIATMNVGKKTSKKREDENIKTAKKAASDQILEKIFIKQQK